MAEAMQDAAVRTIETVEQNLPKWRTWFPNEESSVEIQRRDLLAMIHFAKIGIGVTNG